MRAIAARSALPARYFHDAPRIERTHGRDLELRGVEDKRNDPAGDLPLRAADWPHAPAPCAKSSRRERPGGSGGDHAARFLAFLCSNSTIVREILACASRMALPLDIAHLSKYRWLIPSGT